MILRGVKLIGEPEAVNISIDDSRIASISTKPLQETSNTLKIQFENALAFPGLINSHDHLDFDLFPQLGNRVYPNYVDWGKHIHQHYKSEINAVLNIPKGLRAQWGIYKNLLCGVTTVLHHGLHLNIENELITIHQECQNLHSVQLEKRWKLRLNNPLKIKVPVVMHIGEGVDRSVSDEINQLIQWNILKRNLIGIHAVAMTEAQARKFKAIVWCPASNHFLLNQTAAIDQLKYSTDILFGTDSTLSAGWDIWEHIRLARQTNRLNSAELLQSLTTTAAKAWQLNSGKIEVGKDADIVIVKPKFDSNGLMSFIEISPKDILLVIHQGNIRLFDESMRYQLHAIDLTKYSRITINGVYKYVQGNLNGLMADIRKYYPGVQFPIKAAQEVEELNFS